MKSKFFFALQLIFGLIFVVFGLNGFFHFIAMPEHSPQAGSFLGALAKTGYFFPFLKLTEIICGALLVLNIFVPLALTILAPVVLNIFLFHLYLEPNGMIMAIALVTLEVLLAFYYRARFSELLKIKS